MTSLETYLRQLQQERPAALNEPSYYGARANLFNAIGDRLKLNRLFAPYYVV